MRTLVLLATLSLALAAVHPRGSLPPGWAQSMSEVLEFSAKPLTVALSLNDNAVGLELVKKHALEVSDPRSLKYGQFLSIEEIARLTAPSDIAVEAVTQWLATSLPATAISQRMSTLEFTCSAAQAEALFNTQFGMLYNSKTGQAAYRAGDFFLPEHLEKHVAAVFGLHGLPLPPRRRTRQVSGPKETSPPIATVTPKVLAKTYGIAGVTPKADTKNSQAAIELEGQTMNPADLTQFFANYITGYKVGVDDVVSKFVGDPNFNAEYGAGGEASLDIQYMMGVSPGIKTEFWLYNAAFCDGLANWTHTTLTTKDHPLVHSLSYGSQSPLIYLYCEGGGIKVVDDNFAKLAAAGVSVIISSGDSGSAYYPLGGDDPNSLPQLWSSWPASSGWVTAVGATRFVDQKVGQPEMAVDQFGSGGGFSSICDHNNSQYMAAAVANYFKVAPHLPNATYPKNGRATPDVSALGEGYQVLIDKNLNVTGGTSASAPVFAGIISLLNEARIQAGKPQLGFLNPWIYQNVDAFTDITLGDSSQAGFGDAPNAEFWSCAKGWDPVTGVGTPIFSKMLAAAMKQ